MTAMTRSSTILDSCLGCPPITLLRPRLAERMLAASARRRVAMRPAAAAERVACRVRLQAPIRLSRCTGCRSMAMGLTPSISASAWAHNLGLPFTDEATLLLDLSRWQAQAWVFLDDFCRLPTQDTDALLDRLLTASSPALTWSLGARRRPACNWPRLLLDDELLECGAELAFNPVEIQALLSHAPGQSVDRRAAVQRGLVRGCAHRLAG